MTTAWFLLVLLWLFYAWMGLDSARPSSSSKLQLFEPIFKQSCSSKSVTCVDDCSFLCVENDAKCIGGTCTVKSPQPIPCNQEKGGILMLDATPKWICFCTNPTIFSGPDCGQLNPDVCEHGVFIYYKFNQYQCLCPYPYAPKHVDGKVHCVEKHISRFFEESVHVTPIGPSVSGP